MARWALGIAVALVLGLTPLGTAAPADLGIARDALDFLRQRHYYQDLNITKIIQAGVPGLRRALEKQGVSARGLAVIASGTNEAAAFAAFGQRLTEATRLAGGRLSEQELLHAGLRAMFRAVGDGTVFATPREHEITQALGRGALAGTGIKLLEIKGQWTITAVAPGGPAERAGLRRGDVLVRVGPEEMSGLTVFQLRTFLLGPSGTPVQVTLGRGARKMTTTVTRGPVAFPVVEHRMLPDGVAYLKIYGYPEGSVSKIRVAAQALAAERPRRLIVDLRDAGDDLWDELLDTLGAFFPSGTIVAQDVKRDMYGTPVPRPVSGTPILTGLPTAVVIGQGTWGTGEITAAAFKEYANAILVGQPTHGVLALYYVGTLRDRSLVGIVVGRALTGKGIALHGRGLTPDVEADNAQALDRALQAVAGKR